MSIRYENTLLQLWKTLRRVLPSYRLNRRIELFAGPSFNYLHSHKGQGADLVSHYIWSDHKQDKDVRGLYFGVTGGVGIKF